MNGPTAPSLLEIDNLSVTFRTAGEGGLGFRDIRAVRGASLHVADGDGPSPSWGNRDRARRWPL